MWDNAGALGRLTRWLLLLMVLMLLGVGVAWIYNSPCFPVKQVSIQDKLSHTDDKQLQAIAHEYIRDNIFRVDVNGVQTAFSQLPWISSAVVRRRLPDTVEIILKGREPVAKRYDIGLVDMQGNVFPTKTPDNLPVFEGQEGTDKDMVQRYREFTNISELQGLKISKLIYTPCSTWSIELDNGIVIHPGREDEIFYLQRSVGIWSSLLKKCENRLAYVDMHYKDGFAVRYSKPLDEPSEKEVQEQTFN